MPFGSPDKTYPFLANWNSVAAVYGIMNDKKQMIYIGQTEDLKRRMDEHANDKAHCMHKYGPALVWVDVISGGELSRRARERALLAEYNPPCNA